MKKTHRFITFVFALIIGSLLLFIAQDNSWDYGYARHPDGGILATWRVGFLYENFLRDWRLYLGIIVIGIGIFCLTLTEKKVKFKKNCALTLSIFWLIFIGATMLVLWHQTNEMIQAIAIITLVFITFYYAIQTYKLVEEGKKKRYADFLANSIEDFYFPLLQKLDQIKEGIAGHYNLSIISNAWKEIGDFFEKKKYMVPRSVAEEIMDFKVSTLIPLLTGEVPEVIEDMHSAYIKLRKLIETQKENIENEIRKFYESGVDMREKDKRG